MAVTQEDIDRATRKFGSDKTEHQLLEELAKGTKITDADLIARLKALDKFRADSLARASTAAVC